MRYALIWWNVKNFKFALTMLAAVSFPVMPEFQNDSPLYIAKNTPHKTSVVDSASFEGSSSNFDINNKRWRKFKGVLTFDDGPHPSTTPSLVDSLVDAGVSDAIFYFVGYRMLEYPELVSLVIDAGFEVGYHSMFHQNLAELSTNEIRDDIRRFKLLMNEVLGYRAELTLGRPPFGGMRAHGVTKFRQLEVAGTLATIKLDRAISRDLVSASIVEAFEAEGLKLMLWNVDFDDWEQEIDVDYAIAKHSPGTRQIWLMHERPVDWRTYRTFDNRLTKHVPRLLSALERRELESRVLTTSVVETD